MCTSVNPELGGVNLSQWMFCRSKIDRWVICSCAIKLSGSTVKVKKGILIVNLLFSTFPSRSWTRRSKGKRKWRWCIWQACSEFKKISTVNKGKQFDHSHHRIAAGFKIKLVKVTVLLEYVTYDHQFCSAEPQAEAFQPRMLKLF